MIFNVLVVQPHPQQPNEQILVFQTPSQALRFLTSSANTTNFSHHHYLRLNTLEYLCSSFLISRLYLPVMVLSPSNSPLYAPWQLCTPEKLAQPVFSSNSPMWECVWGWDVCVCVCVQHEQSMGSVVRKAWIWILGMRLSASHLTSLNLSFLI